MNPPGGIASTRFDTRPATGLRGEHLAARHLEHRGYEVLGRKVRTPSGEIDLIARRGALLVFVEVKTARMRRADGSAEIPVPNPLESLRHRQRMRIRRAALAWLRGAGGADSERKAGWSAIRFDAIGVVLSSRWELQRLDHVEGAW